MNSSIAQPPAKCPRCDPDEHGVSPECIRSKPWFEDGNIVLETERVQFKVYKGILAANSAIFRDMFAIAQAQEGELVEGCPVVHLADKPKDLGHVLEVLYGSRKWHEDNAFDERTAMPIAVLEAFLRLGRKYEIDHIRKQAVQRLAVAFPSDLNKYRDIFASHPPRPIQHSVQDYLALVNVLRANDLLVHLPTLLFLLILADHYDHVPIITPAPETQQSMLSCTDIQLCHKAHIKLMHLHATVVFSWVQPWEARHARSTDACSMQHARLHQAWFRSAGRDFNGPMISTFGAWKDGWDNGFCEECSTHARQKFAEGQEQVFEMLPAMFNLPGWAELRGKWSTSEQYTRFIPRAALFYPPNHPISCLPWAHNQLHPAHLPILRPSQASPDLPRSGLIPPSPTCLSKFANTPAPAAPFAGVERVTEHAPRLLAPSARICPIHA
ncbi:hypothetical protein FIBSPDRAFT_1041132 [Athelia psychrophila]|uniref:BTB domain-containing protein n=1 Tax=Athelia psychrophila TaxID=1759441 RepID=A0A166PGV7_9AGAM|nr:hypothetical protein FIBSPDRAFT_1041132 [Fibularhizoctonia sp. CBS 109695]